MLEIAVGRSGGAALCLCQGSHTRAKKGSETLPADCGEQVVEGPLSKPPADEMTGHPMVGNRSRRLDDLNEIACPA